MKIEILNVYELIDFHKIQHWTFLTLWAVKHYYKSLSYKKSCTLNF